LNPSLIGIIYRVNGTDRLYTKQLKIRKFKRATQRLDKDFDDDLNRRLFIEHTGGLVNLLHYGDAVSMKHSLESRLPFMDFRLVEFLFTLPMDFKLNEGMGKFIHRKVMDGILPNYITENRLKFGFENPLHEIFLSDDFGMPKSILLSEKFHERGLFSRKQVVKYLDGLGSGNVDKARFLYRILCVELWFREFIDAK
jgi:asparagine synthase (glutamine-hydrolysing)